MDFGAGVTNGLATFNQTQGPNLQDAKAKFSDPKFAKARKWNEKY